MRSRHYIIGILLIFHSLFLYAATNDVVPSSPDEQMEFQLRTQELQLQQQLLQVKQKLLQLQQAKAQKPTSVQVDLHWVDAYDGQHPANSIADPICRANYENGTHPGQLVTGGCLITYGGHAILQKKYQVLTGKQRTFWKPSDALVAFQNQPLPISAYGIPRRNWVADHNSAIFIDFPVQGGFEEDHPLYICRAMYNNEIHWGKVVANNCNIAAKDKEIAVPTYEVLFSSLQ